MKLSLWQIALTDSLTAFQPGGEEVHRGHQLQGEDLQHLHTMWELYLLRQRRRDGVRLEYRHGWEFRCSENRRRQALFSEGFWHRTCLVPPRRPGSGLLWALLPHGPPWRLLPPAWKHGGLLRLRPEPARPRVPARPQRWGWCPALPVTSRLCSGFWPLGHSRHADIVLCLFAQCLSWRCTTQNQCRRPAGWLRWMTRALGTRQTRPLAPLWTSLPKRQDSLSKCRTSRSSWIRYL